MSFAKALMVPLIMLALVIGYFAGAVPAIEPIIGIADTTIENNPDGPIDSTATDRLSWMAFIGGPIGFIAAGFVFVVLFSIKAERILRGM